MASYIVNLLREHASAPRWTDAVDPEPVLTPDVLEKLHTFEAAIDSAARDSGLAGVILREAIETAVDRGRLHTAQYRRSLANGPTHIGIEDLPHLPTVGRADLASRPEAFIPDNADLTGLEIARVHVPGVTAAGAAAATALVPTHALASAAEAALLMAALRRRGIAVELAPDLVALVRVDRGAAGPLSGATVEAQRGPAWPEPDAGLKGPAWPDPVAASSGPAWPDPSGAAAPAPPRGGVTGGASPAGGPPEAGGFRGAISASLAALGGAGYLRFDLSAETWRHAHDPVRMIAAFAPAVVAGTALAIEELTVRAEDALRAGPTAPRMRVRAVLVSAGSLARALRDRIEKAFSAPVIDWYGVPEAGPLAYGCSAGRGLHVLPPDVWIESDASTGELALTGGRNPFLPLIRYRPGDRGRIDKGACSCGDRNPRIVGFERA